MFVNEINRRGQQDPNRVFVESDRAIRATDLTIANSRASLNDTRTIVADSKRAIARTKKTLANGWSVHEGANGPTGG